MTNTTLLGTFNTKQISRYTTLPPNHVSWYRESKAAIDPDWDPKRTPLDIRDLIELRLYNFIYRHYHIIKSELHGTFDLVARDLNTRYPFSHPGFLNNLQTMVRNSQLWQDFTVDQERLNHIVSCIDRRPDGTPIRWHIGLDLMLPEPAERIVIDPALHPSDPVIDGTQVSIIDVEQYLEIHDDEYATQLHFNINEAQLHSCLCLASALDLAKNIRAISDLTHIIRDDEEPAELETLRKHLAATKQRLATPRHSL